jgi:hypothetical protein
MRWRREGGRWVWRGAVVPGLRRLPPSQPGLASRRRTLTEAVPPSFRPARRKHPNLRIAYVAQHAFHHIGGPGGSFGGQNGHLGAETRAFLFFLRPRSALNRLAAAPPVRFWPKQSSISRRRQTSTSRCGAAAPTAIWAQRCGRRRDEARRPAPRSLTPPLTPDRSPPPPAVALRRGRGPRGAAEGDAPGDGRGQGGAREDPRHRRPQAQGARLYGGVGAARGPARRPPFRQGCVR